jgi:hypothetical protein
MNKYFLFKADNPINATTFRDLIRATYPEPFTFFMRDSRSGHLLTDAAFFDVWTVLLPLFHNDLGILLTSIVSHKADELAWYALEVTYKTRRQTCLHLGEVLFERMLAHDSKMIAIVRAQFANVSRELMLTAKAFIDAGLNATRAAVKLYVHRNTFNYRLDKFIEQTGLDIRDYHHAFYFKLAQQAIIG